jgi:hypothetical protein
MPRLKRQRHNPGKAVPTELLFIAYHWESLRELYFSRNNEIKDADEARKLREVYARRIWDDCGISVGFDR